jgi:hypothetical protein
MLEEDVWDVGVVCMPAKEDDIEEEKKVGCTQVV